MAKVKSSGLRNYIGKLGGNVYYMRAGQNIARELAAQVSNPRTAAQMGQRTALANLVRFYQVSKSWMEARAFEFRKANQSVYNALVSANISSTPVYLDKGDVDNGIVVAAPYRVADGSLPSIGAYYEAADDKFVLRINVGELTITNDLTIAQLSAAIIGGNTAQDWQEGDQLSVIIYEQGELLGTGQWKLAMASFEFIIDSEDSRLMSEVYPDFYGILDKNTDGDLVTDDLGPLFEGFDDTYGFACVAVHSRTYKGATTVSREELALDGDATSWLEHYTGATARRRAGQSYGQRAEYFLDAQRVQHEGGSAQSIVDFNGIRPNEFGGAILQGQTCRLTLSQPLDMSAEYNVVANGSTDIGEDIGPMNSNTLNFIATVAVASLTQVQLYLNSELIASASFKAE